MPHYRWFATDAQGLEYEGVLWATTPEMLHDELDKRGLHLVAAQQQALLSFGQRWRLADSLHFFEQLQQLLAVGLLLSQALAIMGRAGTRVRRALAIELQQGIAHGGTLAGIMQQWPDFFDAMVVTLIGNGHDSTTLARVLEQVVQVLRARKAVRAQLWSALATPLLTLVFFVGVVLIIFLAVVPSLEQVVLTTGQHVPPSLQGLFSISYGLHAYGLFGFLACIIVIAGGGWALVRSTFGKKICAWLACFTPWVGAVYWDFQLSLIFQATGVLVRNGVDIALATAQISAFIGNPYVRTAVEHFGNVIASGTTPAHAYEQVFGVHATPEVSAMLEVGQQSGALSHMCEYAGQFYFERAQSWLKHFVLWLQPVLMVFLGFLVAGLLYAVYTPLVQLPELVNQTGV